MRKSIILRLSVVITAFLLCFTSLPSRAYAEEMTEAEKIRLSGQLLSDFMELLLDQYMGDPITPEQLLEAALSGMTDVLDPYSYYMSSEDMSAFDSSLSGKITGIGVLIRTNEEEQIEIVRVLPATPAEEAGLRRGDIILSVNGRATEGLTSDEVTDIITDEKVSKIALQVLRGSKELSFRMEKREISSTTVYTDRLEDLLGSDNAEAYAPYRYINITSVSDNTNVDLQNVLDQYKKENVQGVVLDMRGNPGGYLHTAVAICNQLVPAGPILYTVDNKGNQEVIESDLANPPFEKIIILVDRYTASAAELITAAMQDAEAAVVIGETTFGKGVIQSIFELTTGGGLSLTTEEYLRRSGEKVNGIGVTPDIMLSEAEMDPALYESPEDAALRRAMEELTGTASVT